MTVSSIIPVNNYEGNGNNKKFDFDFLIESSDELVVTLLLNDGTKKTLTYGIDYSINEIKNQSGSYIIFPLEQSTYKVLKKNEYISLALDLEIKQESEFENSSYLKLNVLEWTFDYIVRILQMLSRKIDRSVKVQEGSTLSPDALVDSIAESEANARVYSSIATNKANEASLSAEKALLCASKTDGINKTQVTNCILSTPQRIKYTLDTDGNFTLKAGSKVFVNGQDYVLPQDANTHLGTDFSKELYVFYHKDTNSVIVTRVADSLSGSTLPTMGDEVDVVEPGSSSSVSSTNKEYSIFYNTRDKSVYRYRNGSWSKQYGESLPIAKITLKAENKVGSLLNIYDWYSVCGNTIVVFPDVKVLMANGLNTDGTKKNIEITTQFTQSTITLDNIRRYVYLASNGQIYALGTGRFGVSNLSDLKNIASGIFRCYIPELNTWYTRSTDGGDWTSTNSPSCMLLKFKDNGSIVSEIAPYTNTLSIADKDEVVDLYNSQEIDGVKTFLENIILKNNKINTWNGISIKNSELDLSNYTKAQQVVGGRFISVDKNNDYFSTFQGYKSANNSKVSSQMIARTYINGDKTKQITSVIECAVNSAGERYTYCPSCSEPNSIVTTVQITETESGIGMKLGNGLIIQWGTNNSSGTTITLPIPMSSNNYSILLGTYIAGSGSGNQSGGWKNKTTTSFFLQHGACDGLDWFVIGR